MKALILIIAVFYLIAALLFNGHNSVLHAEEETIGIEIENIFKTSEISCNSNSMGLTLNCKDTAYWQKIKDFDEGAIYIYKKEDNHIVHRLVKDCRKGCYGLIFKGDNNLRADDIVNESQILGHVTRVNYYR